MSVGAIASFIMGFALIVGSILAATDRPESFIDFPSVLVVLGGTFAALFISFEPKTAFSALRTMLEAFKRHPDSEKSLKDEVGRIVRWAYIVQKSGLQGLENEISDKLREEDPFLAAGADLVVTGYTGAEIKQILEHMLESKAARDAKITDALKKNGWRFTGIRYVGNLNRFGYYAWKYGGGSGSYRTKYGGSIDYDFLRHYSGPFGVYSAFDQISRT